MKKIFRVRDGVGVRDGVRVGEKKNVSDFNCAYTVLPYGHCGLFALKKIAIDLQELFFLLFFGFAFLFAFFFFFGLVEFKIFLGVDLRALSRTLLMT